MLKTQNKSEWSETYCIIKILSCGNLKLCDSKLGETGETIKILGGYLGSKKEHTGFSINENHVLLQINEENIIRDNSFFLKLEKNILSSLNQKQGNTFSIEEVNGFFESLGINKIKSSSLSKSDLLLLIDDKSIIDSCASEFSIKSFLASNPTLVNASKATNFRYKVLNIKTDEFQKYQAENLRSKRLVRKIQQGKCDLKFDGIDSNIFRDNLFLIDTNMPYILSEALKIYYSSSKKFVSEIAAEIKKNNPFSLDNLSIYENKLKDYLFYSSVGIFPDKVWNGLSSVDGGCIIVCNDGDLKTFYIIRKNYLEYYRDFLFHTSYFDTASNTRHKFGSIYIENDIFYLKLNLQIRLDLGGLRKIY
jgi:hypothetical protein